MAKVKAKRKGKALLLEPPNARLSLYLGVSEHAKESSF